MTEKQFFDKIKEETGFNMGYPTKEKSFGFILGAIAPFVPEQRMIACSNSTCFEVWKREGNLGAEIKIHFKDSQDALNKTIEFLKKPIVRPDANAEIKQVGEYDRVAQG